MTRPTATRLAALVGAIGVAAGLLTACNSSGNSFSAKQFFPNSALCHSIHRINQLAVKRLQGANHGFMFPRVVYVGNRSEAQKVLEEVCALPKPNGVTACPAEYGIVYKLYFGHVAYLRRLGADKGSTEAENGLTLNPTGCQLITGMGTSRWVLGNAGFYRMLGQAMSHWAGLSSPSRLALARATQQTFVGEPGAGSVVGTLRIGCGTLNCSPTPTPGRVGFVRVSNFALIVKGVSVGRSGDFNLTLPAGRWRASGSSPRYKDARGHEVVCVGPHVTVRAGQTTRTDILCPH